MTVNSLKHDYFILVMLGQSTTHDIMLASYDDTQESKDIFTVICIKDIDVVMNLTSFFLDLDHSFFTDFIECFILENSMYLVFKYEHQTESDILINRIQDMKLLQRAGIAKAIISKIILLRVSYPIMCVMLKPENIVVIGDNSIAFNYFIENFGDYNNDCKNKAMVYLSYLLKLMFDKELAYNQSAELAELIVGIQNNEFEDVLSIYTEFCKVYDRLILLEEINTDKKLALIEKLNLFKTKALSKFMPILAGVIILIGLIYLVNTIKTPSESTQKGSIEAIGDLTIE